MPDDIGAIERHIEEEPQRRTGAVDRSRAGSARCQMQQIAADIFSARTSGRAPKKNGKVLDAPNVIGLRLGHEIADRHVFDHAPTQRADALIGHGILLSVSRLLTPDLQTGRPVPLPRSRQLQPPPCAQRSTAPAVSFNDPKRTIGQCLPLVWEPTSHGSTLGRPRLNILLLTATLRDRATQFTSRLSISDLSPLQHIARL
jgi:hypothetical protein